MAYCCVPLCTSKSKKCPGISFHEIPCDIELRRKWIKAISRDNWTPNSNSNYSRVCSKHFLSSDYSQGLKIKRLKFGAIPSQFPNYPIYMQRNITQPRKSSYCSRTIDNDSVKRSNDFNRESELCIEQQPDPIFASAVEQMIQVTDMNNKCTQVDILSQVNSLELKQWKRRVRYLSDKLEKLQQKTDKLTEELDELNQVQHLQIFVKIVNEAHDNTRAQFLLDQVANFYKKRPTWCEQTVRQCIILRNMSTKTYEHLRKVNLLNLPSRNTLKKYIGDVSGETGITQLVLKRLEVELLNLKNHQSKMCSLIVDEMKIQEKMVYHRQRDQFLGAVDTGIMEEAADYSASEPVLAKSLLCFVLIGLSVNFRIPVAYYFVKDLTGVILATLTQCVLKTLMQVGYVVVRIVTDNLAVNTSAFRILCDGELKYEIAHPYDASRKLFLSYDPVHVQKNIRSQFLDRDMSAIGITAKYVKLIYNLQRNSILKPVRYLTRKHLFPNNLEKMNALRSIQLFLPPVTSALKFCQSQAGRTCDPSFASAGKTVEFMEIIFKWFLIHDTSNKTQHIHQRLGDCKQFEDPNDERLNWLTSTFLNYLENLKKEADNKKCSFLTAETYEAVQFTSRSTAACVKYLLKECGFLFVLTRKFSSDAIESMFGYLRRSSGPHDQLDVNSTISGLEKILKTGIIIASESSNVVHAAEQSSTDTRGTPRLSASSKPNFKPLSFEEIPSHARSLLLQLKVVSTSPPLIPTPRTATLCHVAGYIARVIEEKIKCEECTAIFMKPKCSQPVQGMLQHLDRGGLVYPSDRLIMILDILQNFLEQMLKSTKMTMPLKTLSSLTVPALLNCPAIKCNSTNTTHLTEVCTIICEKFYKPMLTNYASTITDQKYSVKKLAHKPLSRKILKVL